MAQCDADGINIIYILNIFNFKAFVVSVPMTTRDVKDAKGLISSKCTTLQGLVESYEELYQESVESFAKKDITIPTGDEMLFFHLVNILLAYLFH